MYMKSGEVMELLDISRNQLYHLVNTGVIPAYKPVGRRLRFIRSEIMAHIENSRVQPKPKPVHITARKKPSRTSGAVYRGEKHWVGGAS